MVQKVHEKFEAGQFLTGALNHFEITKVGMVEADLKAVVEIVGTRATVVILGEIQADVVRVAVENNGAWDAVTLGAELAAADPAITVADFVY